MCCKEHVADENPEQVKILVGFDYDRKQGAKEKLKNKHKLVDRSETYLVIDKPPSDPEEALS